MARLRTCKALLLLLFDGCAPARLYEGPRLDPAQRVVVDLGHGTTAVSIDSTPVEGRSFELRPGSHLFRIRIERPLKVKGLPISLGQECLEEIDATAETNYVFVARISKSQVAKSNYKPKLLWIRHSLESRIENRTSNTSSRLVACSGRLSCLMVGSSAWKSETINCEAFAKKNSQ